MKHYSIALCLVVLLYGAVTSCHPIHAGWSPKKKKSRPSHQINYRKPQKPTQRNYNNGITFARNLFKLPQRNKISGDPILTFYMCLGTLKEQLNLPYALPKDIKKMLCHYAIADAIFGYQLERHTVARYTNWFGAPLLATALTDRHCEYVNKLKRARLTNNAQLNTKQLDKEYCKLLDANYKNAQREHRKFLTQKLMYMSKNFGKRQRLKPLLMKVSSTRL